MERQELTVESELELMKLIGANPEVIKTLELMKESV